MVAQRRAYNSAEPLRAWIWQIQSNALAALEAIDSEMAEEILANGCITGDRVNGLCDGVTGDWCEASIFPTAHTCICSARSTMSFTTCKTWNTM